MSIPKRHQGLPGTYFVTSRTCESRALFISPEICQLFVSTLLNYRDAGSFLLHAFVLMPDHFHALLTPVADKSLERVVQYIKGGSARVIAKDRELRFPVWQRGFSDHRIRDASDLRIHREYIGQNPVKRRLLLPGRIDKWSLTCLQQRLVKTGGRLVKHARYYWLLLAGSHLTRRLFGQMLRRVDALPVPGG